MARFVLQPCKLRDERLVPVKGEPPITLNWRELCERLAPSREQKALQVLQLVQVNSYVGTTKNPHGTGKPANFVLMNPDRSGNLAKIMSKDATFAHRLLSVYRVDDVEWDARVTELGASKRP